MGCESALRFVDKIFQVERINLHLQMQLEFTFYINIF